MSFVVSLGADSVSVEPGGSIPVTIDVTNQGSEADRYELTVEGIDHEWVVVPVPSFVVEPKSGQTSRFFIRPPRDSHSMAGNYPFVVSVRSLESGTTQQSQGTVEIKAYTHLSVDVQPRRVYVSPYRRTATLDVNVANMGNVEQTLQLFATDTDDVIAFDFEQDQIRVSPGQQTTVKLTATAGSSPFLANPRLQPVTVSARSVSSASLAASTSLQVEQRGLFSIGAAVFMLVAALIAFAWYATRPKPPLIDSLSATPMNPTVGSIIDIKWQASNATSVQLSVGGTVNDKQPTTGEYTFVAKDPGKLTITAVALNDNHRSEQSVQIIDIIPKVLAPDAKILNFSVSPTKAKVGEKVTVNYLVSDGVTSLYLSPFGPLEPKGSGYSFTPDKPGDMELKLTARNADGKVEEQTTTIHVVQVSDAVISGFSATPTSITGTSGLVTLTWSVDKAAKAQITYGDNSIPIQAPAGTSQVTITETTTFILTATDAQGISTTKKITVDVSPPPVDTPIQPGTQPVKPKTDNGPGTGGGTGDNGKSPKMPGGGHA